MSETHDEPVVAHSSPTLGERLRQAREAKKYTVAEVAAQLRLTKDIVGYLENQDWERLNGRTYARGYFANYVKFLGLPYEEMLAVFNLEYTASEPALNLKQHGHSVDDKPFPGFLLGLVVIVSVVIWLAYQQWQNNQLLRQSSVTTSEQMAEIEEDDFNESVVEPLQNEAVIADIAPAPAVSTTVDDTLGTTTDDLGISDESFSEIHAAEQMSSAAGPVEQQLAQPEPTPAATLRLQFSGECWVEVSNADAKVLVSKVMQASDSLELSADQPLNLLLGRAEAATVIFNNEQVDLKPYTQGDVARLTLGVES